MTPEIADFAVGGSGADPMAVEIENVQKLMGWLAQDSPVRSSVTSTDMLAQKLATVVFQGDAQWADHPDQVDSYRDTLNTWFSTDSGNEQQFTTLTAQDADPAAFVDWFLTVVTEWESQAGAGGQQPNPQDGADSPNAEPGRYSEPARDDNYGLTYRYDNRDGVYQWYDEAAQKWQDQAWADQQHAAAATGPAAQSEHQPQSQPQSQPHTPATESHSPTTEREPAWDENWNMFYRVDADGTYQFADAATPGDKASGCSNTWLTQDQVVARTTTGQATDHAPAPTQHQPAAADAHAAAAEALHAHMLAAVGSAFESNPALQDTLTDEHIRSVLADVAKEVIG